MAVPESDMSEPLCAPLSRLKRSLPAFMMKNSPAFELATKVPYTARKQRSVGTTHITSHLDAVVKHVVARPVSDVFSMSSPVPHRGRAARSDNRAGKPSFLQGAGRFSMKAISIIASRTES